MNINNANQFFLKNSYPDTPESIAPILILDHLRSPENIGNIIRLAGNTGCKKVLIINSGDQPKISKIKRLAEVAGEITNWQFCHPKELQGLIPDNYTLTALETSPLSLNITEANLPERMALVVGNERSGIYPELLKAASLHLHIPVTGKIKSFNVSHATGLCLFEWVRQHVIHS